MASELDLIAFRLRGAKNWPWIDATVSSIDMERRGKASSPRLNYTFWQDGHIYSGASWIEPPRGIDSYQKDEVIQVQFNPADPNQCFFPEQESLSTALAWFIGGIVAVVLSLLVWYGIEHMNR